MISSPTQQNPQDDVDQSYDAKSPKHNQELAHLGTMNQSPEQADTFLSVKKLDRSNLQKRKSIFNETELKRAPTIFERDNCEIQNQIDLHDDGSQEIKNAQNEIKENEEVKKSVPVENKQSVCQKITNIRQSIYMAFEDPMSSIYGKILHWSVQFFIIVSVTLIITDSVYLKDDTDVGLYSDISGNLENVVFGVFLFEFILRLSVCTSFGETFWAFIKQPLNIIDFVSLFPFFIDIVLQAFTSFASLKVGLLRVIRIIRLIRIVRIFKLSRYLKGLQTLSKSLGQSINYFPFICATLVVFNIFVSIIIYYFEINTTFSDEELASLNIQRTSQITSIPQSMWFVLQTMTTLGYGDLLPLTVQSKLLSGIIALASQSFVIGLPIAIVGFDFSNVYKEEKEQEKFNKYKSLGLQEQTGTTFNAKELQFMQERLRKISKTNKLIRELSSRSSKMCFLITKDLVSLFFQVVITEQREMERKLEGLNLQNPQKWANIQKILSKKQKLKVEDIKASSFKTSSIRGLKGNGFFGVLQKLVPQDEQQTEQENKQVTKESRGFRFIRENLSQIKKLFDLSMKSKKVEEDCVKSDDNEKNTHSSRPTRIESSQTHLTHEEFGKKSKNAAYEIKKLTGMFNSVSGKQQQHQPKGDESSSVDVDFQFELLSEMFKDLSDSYLELQEIDEYNEIAIQNEKKQQELFFQIDRLEKIQQIDKEKQQQLVKERQNFKDNLTKKKDPSSADTTKRYFDSERECFKKKQGPYEASKHLCQQPEIKLKTQSLKEGNEAEQAKLDSSLIQQPCLISDPNINLASFDGLHQASDGLHQVPDESKDQYKLLFNISNQKSLSIRQKSFQEKQDHSNIFESRLPPGKVMQIINLRKPKKSKTMDTSINKKIQEQSDEEEHNYSQIKKRDKKNDDYFEKVKQPDKFQKQKMKNNENSNTRQNNKLTNVKQ